MIQSDKPSEVIIRTSVREVLVPVVITDKKGHYVRDLKASDFEVTEDGVMQKVIAFSTASGSEAIFPANGTTSRDLAGPSAVSLDPKAKPARRTYWILIDTLHSSFTNFNRVREALAKFFQQERSPDSQYSIVAIGRSVGVVQDSTADPTAALNAIQDKKIEKMILDSEASNTSYDADRFTGAVRQYCEVCQGACLNWPATGNQEWCSARTGQVSSMLTQAGERSLGLSREFLTLLKNKYKPW